MVLGCSLGSRGCSKNEIGNTAPSEEKKKPERIEIVKDARRKIIEICLVEILSASMAYHLMTNRMSDFDPKNA
jgi:hypothetical protein